MDEKSGTEEEENESDKEGDKQFDKMMKNSSRYFLGENQLIRCKNCNESGHWARECPNETKRAACILCGKDTHDSFTCTEKICFKCNKVGHLAINCQETYIIKCNRCGLNGHKEIRCLKVWRGNEYTQSQMQFLKCVECGKPGHIKCTKERESNKIMVDVQVKDDLEEFVSKFFVSKETTKFVGDESDDSED